VLVVVSVMFFDKVKIDDPVGAISVHGVNGAWGLLAVGIFSDGSYGQGWNGVGAADYMERPGGASAASSWGTRSNRRSNRRGRRGSRLERDRGRPGLLHHRQES